LNSRRHVHLKPLKKTNFDARIYDEYLDLVPLILPNLRTPLWGFWQPLWQLFYNIDSRYNYKKFPLPKCILTFICHSVLQFTPLLSSSSFKHQPFIAIPYFEVLLLFCQVIGAIDFSTTNPIDTPPSSLMDLTMHPNVKTTKGKGVGALPGLQHFEDRRAC
jgi:hypothetical protein